ncbi:MAG: hypothetical protein U5K74_08900 [Gemmatimonadaceae bacterium]|nr:hypothetical protein [Gemmatimonadaceae bacterium]
MVFLEIDLKTLIRLCATSTPGAHCSVSVQITRPRGVQSVEHDPVVAVQTDDGATVTDRIGESLNPS